MTVSPNTGETVIIIPVQTEKSSDFAPAQTEKNRDNFQTDIRIKIEPIDVPYSDGKHNLEDTSQKSSTGKTSDIDPPRRIMENTSKPSNKVKRVRKKEVMRPGALLPDIIRLGNWNHVISF